MARNEMARGRRGPTRGRGARRRGTRAAARLARRSAGGARLAVRTRALEAGQSMVEYAIVLALVAVVAMVAIQALGGGITLVFQNILVKIQGLGR